jgi:hypothetical protein
MTEGHVAVASPPVAELVAALTYHTRTFAPGGHAGWREVEQVVALGGYDLMGRLAFPAGLLGRVQRVLAEKGYAVDIRDLRPADDRMTLAAGAEYLFTPRQREVLDAVALHPLGRVEVADDEEALDHSVALIEAFPRVGFAIAVPTRSDALQAWRRISERLREDIGLVTSGTRRAAPRVLVGTPGIITPNTVRRPDVLLLPFAERSTGRRFLDAAVGAQFRRIYAFVRQPEQPDRLTQLRLEQLAGPLVVPRQPTRRPVRVALFDVPDVGVSSHLVTEQERKHAWYWTNSVRNRAIAAVARGLQQGAPKLLRRVGLKAGDEAARRVAVLVECPVHGRELVKFLPEWALLTIQMGGHGPTGGVIVTEAYAAQHPFEADVLLRATGTGWPLRVLDFPPAQITEDLSEVLLVDFRDGFSTETARLATQRLQEYRRAGMIVEDQ